MTDLPNSEAIAEELKSSVNVFLAAETTNLAWKTLVERMTDWFSTLNEQTRFEAALMVLKSPVYQHQLLMGDVLRRSRTPLLNGPYEFVKGVAPTINPSANTIAQYLNEQAGGQSAIDACQAVLAEATDARTHQGVATFLYFLDVGKP